MSVYLSDNKCSAVPSPQVAAPKPGQEAPKEGGDFTLQFLGNFLVLEEACFKDSNLRRNLALERGGQKKRGAPV